MTGSFPKCIFVPVHFLTQVKAVVGPENNDRSISFRSFHHGIQYPTDQRIDKGNAGLISPHRRKALFSLEDELAVAPSVGNPLGLRWKPFS